MTYRINGYQYDNNKHECTNTEINPILRAFSELKFCFTDRTEIPT